jgi:APA family basic amino acid/polyamine antiporter
VTLSSAPDLPRRLTLLDAASVLAGTVIGGGIFLVPGVVARNLPSAAGILLVWTAAGILSFFAALAYAELGAMLPATGGQYVFLREAYGPLWGFLCGWSLFAVILTSQIAWLGIGFSMYLSQFVPLRPFVAKVIGILVIAAISAVNYFGAKAGALVQKLFLFLKLTGLAIIIGSAFASPAVSAHGPGPGAITGGGIGLAMLACLLAYDSWAMVSYMAGEIERPQRNVPLALGLGTAAVIAVYLLANAAFLRILPVSQMAVVERPGAEVAARTIGPAGATLVTITILLSITGALNGATMASPRIYFAQARDGLFFARFGEVHARFQTPAFAILVQAVWAAVLVVTGSFEILISFAIFAAWVFYAITVGAVLVLRQKRPDAARPYRMWGYPFTTIAFLAVAVWFLTMTFIQAPQTCFWSMLLIGSGIPIYYLWRRRQTSSSSGAPNSPSSAIPST